MSAGSPSSDALSRFVFERAAVRGAFVRLDDTSRAILACHPYPPALARIIAELAAAAALLAATLKFDGSLIVQLSGDGPVRLLVVECDGELNLRATAQWSEVARALPADAPLATLAGGPAHGRLAIMLDPKGAGQIYQGIVALQATSVSTLIEHYLSTSEQIESRLVLATSGGAARGLLVQRMPGATAGDDQAWRRASDGATALDDAALFGAPDTAALLPQPFASDDRTAIERLIHDYPFATLVTPSAREPLISHVPLLLEAEPPGTLIGHFARANPHARHAGEAESIAIFHGPHAYVSPSFYGEPAAAVPTWNYAVAHAYGTLEFADSAEQTRAIVDRLVERFESTREAPWRLGLDPPRPAAMLRAIVGSPLRAAREQERLRRSAAANERPAGRTTKRERRRLEDFLNED